MIRADLLNNKPLGHNKDKTKRRNPRPVHFRAYIHPELFSRLRTIEQEYGSREEFLSHVALVFNHDSKKQQEGKNEQ